MLKNTSLAFGLAIQNIRSNFFHTVLSVLGIVIGVAALVSILSFIDGLEKYVKEQIAKTTDLNSLLLSPETHRKVGEVNLKKDNLAYLDYAAYDRLSKGLPHLKFSVLMARLPGAEVWADTAAGPVGAGVQAMSTGPMPKEEYLAGQPLRREQIEGRQPVAIVNDSFAKHALGHGRYAELLGKSLRVAGRVLRVVGVTRSTGEESVPRLTLPVTLLTADELREYPPSVLFEAESVEYVSGMEAEIKRQLRQQFPGHDSDFNIVTYGVRVEQASKGFLLFRIIMGLIVGISIVVGGVGVMNVLLISVKERTAEIGIRKAVGAKRRDILRLFLAESITVSAFGSFLGLIVGILATMIIIPIVKAVTELPFEAAYTWNTFFTISIIAVLVGVVFGTYPAMKAARLDPVEAIRRE